MKPDMLGGGFLANDVPRLERFIHQGNLRSHLHRCPLPCNVVVRIVTPLLGLDESSRDGAEMASNRVLFILSYSFRRRPHRAVAEKAAEYGSEFRPGPIGRCFRNQQMEERVICGRYCFSQACLVDTISVRTVVLTGALECSERVGRATHQRLTLPRGRGSVLFQFDLRQIDCRRRIL